MTITHISDTAHWVAMYRAMESERPDALFRDPYARRLAGARGEAILRTLPKGRRMAWPMIVRTAVMDEIILRAVTRDGIRVVVNLAAGLDTRPYRLPLPTALQWFDVDFPDIQQYKREAIGGDPPRCALEYVSTDLADSAARRALLDRVGRGPAPAFVITEGLLVYLAADQVAALARDLHGCTPIRWWLTDLASPRLLGMLKRTWGRTLDDAGTPLRFGPAEGTAFFEPHGWREAEFRSMWEEALRLRRTMRFAGLWNLLGRLYPARTREEFRRMSGMVLLERCP
jgi:methyltransferase (TIGR00027 family)